MSSASSGGAGAGVGAGAAAAAATVAAAGNAPRNTGGSNWWDSLKRALPFLIPFIVAIGFLGGNIGLLASLAGSKDDWDSIKTKMGGSIAICFIGSAFFAIALYLFVMQYNLGNLQVPILISIIVSSLSLAIGLSALGVAAITR